MAFVVHCFGVVVKSPNLKTEKHNENMSQKKTKLFLRYLTNALRHKLFALQLLATEKSKKKEIKTKAKTQNLNLIRKKFLRKPLIKRLSARFC